MVITDKFVFLHYPKTGGSFVREILRKVHAKKARLRNRPMWQELMMPNLKRIHGADVCHPHGTYEQIPEEHKAKSIVSCIRNPFDRYVSTYEYQNWLQWHPGQMEEIMEQYPEFPELSFERYLSFINRFDIRSRIHHDRLKIDIGMITYSFLQFFFKEPQGIIQGLDENYLNSNEYQKDMPEIVFLRSENLNLDLYHVLLKFGYRKKDISFIMEEGKVNVTKRRSDKCWQDYYCKGLYDYVKFKERFILKVFPEYDHEAGFS